MTYLFSLAVDKTMSMSVRDYTSGQVGISVNVNLNLVLDMADFELI